MPNSLSLSARQDSRGVLLKKIAFETNAVVPPRERSLVGGGQLVVGFLFILTGDRSRVSGSLAIVYPLSSATEKCQLSESLRYGGRNRYSSRKVLAAGSRAENI
jgi:hypothetical protein